MNKRSIYIVLGLVFSGALGGAWVLFRPELLFVKTQVNEEFPAAASRVSAKAEAAMSLLSQRGRRARPELAPAAS